MALNLGGERFMFAETPTTRIAEISCLTFTMLRDFNDNLFRVLLNDSNDLQELHNYHMYKSQGLLHAIQLELPIGNYSLLFESQQIDKDTTYIIVDEVSVASGTCNQSECKCKINYFLQINENRWYFTVIHKNILKSKK